jgi:hypothetical protein
MESSMADRRFSPSRVRPLFKSPGTGTTTGRYCATLKPKDFPDRTAPGRFLDRFEMLSARSVAGRFWITRKMRSSSRNAPLLRTVAGSFTMVEQAHQYRSGDPNVDAFDENTADHRSAPYKLRRSARTDLYVENSLPLFLSDCNGEPDPSEYITPLLKKRFHFVTSSGGCLRGCSRSNSGRAVFFGYHARYCRECQSFNGRCFSGSIRSRAIRSVATNST